jgi:hypothetical protein
MKSKYGDLSDSQVSSNEKDLIDQIFSLLPAKENDDSQLDYLFDIVLFRINGLNVLLSNPPELITVMSNLESARTETQFKLYRKAILDSCSTIHKLMNGGDDHA